MKKIIKLIGIALSVLILNFSCTDLEEEVFSTVSSQNYYQKQNDVYAVLLKCYHRLPNANDVWVLNEVSADQLSFTQKGQHWQDGGVYHRIHRHQWTPSEHPINTAWSNVYSSIGYCNSAIEDFEKLDYNRLDLTEDDKALHLAELRILRAFYQLRAFDVFGSIPISTNMVDVVGCSTKQENFDFIKNSILENINTLPVSNDGNQSGRLTQGAAATILMRLYFNAKTYIGVEMFEETEKLAEDIIKGVYGTYVLDDDWNDLFCAENTNSKEFIFRIPQARNQNYDNSISWNSHIFGNTPEIFNSVGGYHGGTSPMTLNPSRNSLGEIYTYKLGNTFESFSDKDLRKKQHVIDDNEVNGYTGMFLVGGQYKYQSDVRMSGVQEWDGIYGMFFNDQCCRFSEYVPVNEKQAFIDKAYESGLTFYVFDQLLPSDNSTQELNGGVRLMKYPVYPDGDSRIREPDQPLIRLSEVYYTLAECKLRKGETQEAVDLVNAVRIRNFASEDRDAEALSAEGFDKYSMLKEWGCEFLGEGRRRTDLIRNEVYISDGWWDKESSNNNYRIFYPIPLQAINSNPLLEKTEGYTY